MKILKQVMTTFFLASGLNYSAVLVAAQDEGAAFITVAVEGPDTVASFDFSGVPSGHMVAGETIGEADLPPGLYMTSETSGTPGYQLVSIRCDDNNSTGFTATGTTRFNIEKGETVTCIYLYKKAGSDDKSVSFSNPISSTSAPADSTPPSPPPSEEVTLPQQEHDDTAAETQCEAPDLVPKEGMWMVTNLPGSMVCGPTNLPLTHSRQSGTLKLLDCGWTVIGTGLSEGTAPLTMRAVDPSSGHYTGSVGGEDDALPMTIEFEWDVQSETHISGQLHSRVSQQGIICNMTRSFDMNYTGS